MNQWKNPQKRNFYENGRPEDLVVYKNPPHPAKNVLKNETCKKALFYIPMGSRNKYKM